MTRPPRVRSALWVASGAALVALSSVIWFGACASTSPAAQAPANVSAAPSGRPSAATPLPPGAPIDDGAPVLNLEEFAPLFTLPELAAAQQAREAGRHAEAAALVERLLKEHPPAETAAPRWHFLLARLRETAEDLSGAADAYRAATLRSWPLQSYARLGLGRVLTRAGHHKESIAALQQIPLDEVVYPESRLLLARAASTAGDEALAIQTYRAHLKSSFAALDWANVSIELSRRLLARGDRDSAVEALALARRVRLREVTDTRLAGAASSLETQALALIPAAERGTFTALSLDERLGHAQALVDARRGAEALEVADTLLAGLPDNERYQTLGCEAALTRAKALALVRQWGKAVDLLVDPIRYCTADPEYRARLLFLSGKYAASDKRYTLAVQRYEQLEKEQPHHRLSDDARLNAALAYLEVGVEARFTELLTAMPEDHPGGDMLLEGMFRLAVRRLEKGDWAGAASVLDRATEFAGDQDSARGQEFAGRERYFRARVLLETGEKERGLDELARIVRELPLSYYMLHAYARLVELDPFRAKRARDDGLAASAQQPFAFERRPEFELPAFQRAMELLRQEEVVLAKREFDTLKFDANSASPAVFWGMALLYARAGAANQSHAIARGLLTDWLRRWPVGDWTKAWQIAFPRPHRGVVERETKRSGVPESLVYAVMREESAFDPAAVSPADAYGLMQLIVPTAKSVAGGLNLPFDSESLKRPHVNVALGCRFLQKLLGRFEQNPWLVIPAYNAGPGRPERWLRERPHLDFDLWVETIPFLETRRYTKRVLASQAAYALLYAPDTADSTLAMPIKLTPP